jgi:hypothetical protein
MVKRFFNASNIVALAFAWSPAQAAGQETSIPQPIQAEYANPTDRYPHNIMGSLMAHTDLIVGLEPCAQCSEERDALAVRLPAHLVFEDFTPRLVDLNGDGRAEIVVVESDQSKGARLAVWDVILDEGKPKLVRGATTDFIGTRFRWLAPIGAADFDRDGSTEFAYVEKPHLDKTLRIVRRDGKHLNQIASIQGVTNHAIGQEEVQSRIEICAGVPTIFALDGSGQLILSIQMSGRAEEVIELSKAKKRHRLDDGTLCNR